MRPVELAEFAKRLLRIKRQEKQIGNLVLWLDPACNCGSRLLRAGSYEPSVTRLMCQNVNEGDVFVDLGAHEGYFSLVAAMRVGDQGHVFTIEPQSRLWPVIIKNFTLNGLCQFTLVPYAVAETAGSLELSLYPSINTGASTAAPTRRLRHLPTEKCSTLPISEIIARYRISRIDLMKIDIEGYELSALRSVGGLLSAGIVKKFIIEVHPERLKKLGFTVGNLEVILTTVRYTRISNGEYQAWEFSGEPGPAVHSAQGSSHAPMCAGT